MASVITNDNLTQHSVDKYNFKVLSMNGLVEEPAIELKEKESVLSPQAQDSEVDSSSLSSSSKESLIESLMKKTEDMSSNFIKLQMKLEDMSEEHKAELIKVKEESFNEGVNAGKEQSSKDEEASMSSAIAQFSTSVLTLESCAKDYEKALEGIKSELVSAALDISKEVVNIELSENSTEVAKNLSEGLIEELQSASKITLKVNPKNHGEISKSVGSLEKVEVISDSAVSEGGVIAISDVGNIDAQIIKRFERVKKAALSE